MSSLNILAIMPSKIKKWAKPFADAVFGTLKQISGVPFNRHFAFVSTDIPEDELEKIKDQIIRTDLFIFVLSPEYMQFEQTHGLLHLVKAREANLKAGHKVVFTVLRETCKMQPYFLQKPLFDFIGESFNTPSFKSKYVKLVKDVVTALKESDKLNSTTKVSTDLGEAEAIPFEQETAPTSAPEMPKPTENADLVSPASVPNSEPKQSETFEKPETQVIQSPAPQPLEDKVQPEIQAEVSESEDNQQAEEEYEPVDFLEPFNNDVMPDVDDIPSAPTYTEVEPKEEEFEDEVSAELTLDKLDESLVETKSVQEKEEDPINENDDHELSFDEITALESEYKINDESVEEQVENEESRFDGFDDESKQEEENIVEQEETIEENEFAENQQIAEESDLEDELVNELEENFEEKINSDLDLGAEDDILSETKDEPKKEGAIVEPFEPVNELNSEDSWDSFLDEGKKSEEKSEPIIPNTQSAAEEEEELQPWTGSASKYEDPDIKKKTEVFEKKKTKTDSLNNGTKPKTKKLRPKRRKKRPKLETDADIVSDEIVDDGFDVLEELGIDIDNIPEEPIYKETKAKSDTASIDDLLDQEDISLEDDLSFDNELVLEDLEDESLEDENVGAEYGMSKITLTDDKEEKKTKKIEKDIVDELDLGDDLNDMDIPKGNCTVFMNKVPENRYDEAIRMIKEINGMDESEIEVLLGRIVVPVLKDVFEEEAEKALDRIKRAGFNGRIRKT